MYVYVTPQILTVTLLIINTSLEMIFQCLPWIFDLKSYCQVLLHISQSKNKKIVRGKNLHKTEYFVGKN